MTEAMTTQKEVWIEPEIRTLDVNETAAFPNIGNDGGRFSDCSKS